MMVFNRLGMLMGGAALLLACSGAPGPELDQAAETTDTTEDGIIRSTSLGGRNEVVLVVAVSNGEVVRGCSGSYFAPRVVLTAAHCLEGLYGTPVYVYWGDNFFADFPALAAAGGPPPVGSPSNFALADSYEQHPNWNAYLKSPDMGVIYLDRKPPFDPLPLGRFRLDNTYVGKQVTISGWGYGQATGPVTGTGGFIQRTGKTKVLGSPTAADYHPDDPNPGMLDPAVRQTVVKLDGRAPNSNGCFGDSGSPIIVNQYGQDYIAGVDYFGGFYCEDYSLYTRIDPFLPFLDNSYKKGGQDLLTPKLACVATKSSTTLTAYFSYENKNGVAVTVPYGTKNQSALDTKNARPKVFAPGKYDYAFGIDFGVNQTLNYVLQPDYNPQTTINVTKNSPRCAAPVQADLTECSKGCTAMATSGCPIQPVYASCLNSCVSENAFVDDFAPQCNAEWTAYRSCLANTTGPSNWVCYDNFQYAPACDEDELMAFYECADLL